MASATSSSVCAGKSAPLQTITCKFDTETIGDIWTPCVGVTLNWAVASGKKSCAVSTNSQKNNQNYGSVSVFFRRPGQCVGQGSYPAISGQSLACTTSGMITFMVG